MRGGAVAAGGPPPWLWVAVAVASVGTLAASLPAYFSSEVTELELSRAARSARVGAFAREVGAAPRPLTVIALGDSSLRFATHLDDAMEAYWRDRVGLDARFLRISHNGATLGTYLDLVDEILALAPDVLLLQDGLLRRKRKPSWEREHRAFQAGVTSPPPYGRRERMRRILDKGDPFRHQQFFARHYFGRLGIGRFADEDWSQRMERREQRGECLVEDRAANLQRFRAKYPADFDHRIHPQVAASAAVLVERAARAGVTVVIAEIPPGEPMARLASVQTRLGSIRDFSADPAHGGALRHWRPPGPFPADHYCDWTHMSEVGRDAWSRWLGERLAAFQESAGR